MTIMHILQSEPDSWFNSLIEALTPTHTVIPHATVEDIDDWHKGSLLLTCWERTDTPQLIERIRNSKNDQTASIRLLVVGEDDLETLLRHRLAAVALLGPGTFYRQLLEQTPSAIAQLAQEIGTIARRRRASISLTMARQYLAGVPLLRGLLSEHTERDIIGPICFLRADPQALESHWRSLGTAISEQLTNCTSNDQRSALDWARVLHAARSEKEWPTASPPNQPSQDKAKAGRWLLVDDNAALWGPALRVIFPALEVLPIQPHVEQEELVTTLATTLLGKSLCRDVDGILLGVKLAHSDRSDTYLEATASVTSQETAKQYSGIKLLERIRKEDVATPILVLTGSRNAFVEQAITAHGGTYLLKPANQEDAKETRASLKKWTSLATDRAHLQRRELMFVTRQHLSLSRGGKGWTQYLEPLRHALALWALSSRSDNSSCEPLRQGTLLSFGLVAEEILTWMAHCATVTLGRSPKYTLTTGANKADTQLFNLLHGTQQQPRHGLRGAVNNSGPALRSVMWYRNQAAHPNREISFKNDSDVTGCATKLLQALQILLHTLGIRPV